MDTKVQLPDGTIKYAIHLVLGDVAVKIFQEGKPGKKLKRKIEEWGDGIIRTFTTSKECQAYELGLNDMKGFLDFAKTPIRDHTKTFGSNGISVLSNDKPPSIPEDDLDEIASIAALMAYSLREEIHNNKEGVLNAILEIIPNAAKQFYSEYGHVTEWSMFLDEIKYQYCYDDLVADFGRNYFEKINNSQ